MEEQSLARLGAVEFAVEVGWVPVGVQFGVRVATMLVVANALARRLEARRFAMQQGQAAAQECEALSSFLLHGVEGAGGKTMCTETNMLLLQSVLRMPTSFTG